MTPPHESAHGAEQAPPALRDAKRLREVLHDDLHRSSTIPPATGIVTNGGVSRQVDIEVPPDASQELHNAFEMACATMSQLAQPLPEEEVGIADPGVQADVAVSRAMLS